MTSPCSKYCILWSSLRNTSAGPGNSSAYARRALRMRPMMTAAPSPEPATSPTTMPSSPEGRTNTSYQSPPTWPDPLADSLLQAARRGGDQLTTRAVQQQHRGGIGIQDLPHPAQQRGEEVVGTQMGQRRIGNRPDFPQLVLRTWRRARGRYHDDRITSPSSGGQRPYRHEPVHFPGIACGGA